MNNKNELEQVNTRIHYKYVDFINQISREKKRGTGTKLKKEDIVGACVEYFYNKYQENSSVKLNSLEDLREFLKRK